MMLYPGISDALNSRNQTRAIAEYDNTVSDLQQEEYDSMMAKAEDYNKRLHDTPLAFYKPGLVSGYDKVLDVTGTGIMGYISIPKIKVELPIYHGVSDSVLNEAVGHLEGSSLPIGGSGTHCCLSGHRGLPSAKLFSDLNKMEVGDTFTITVLDRLLTYKVDQIKTVLPNQVDELQIVDGKDYCTLITCTPYGVNSHRLLVRGVRTVNERARSVPHVQNDALRISRRQAVLASAAALLIILAVFMLVRYKKKQS